MANPIPAKDEVPYVIILWEDAWGDATTSVTLKDVDDSHKPTQMEIRGWLIKEDEKAVQVATERCLDPGQEISYRGRSYIQKALIKSITPVKLIKPRKPKPLQVP